MSETQNQLMLTRTALRPVARQKANLYRLLCASAALSVLCMLIAAPAQNMISNGDFEVNSAAGTSYNMGSATFAVNVANATEFGTAQEIDLITGNPYGLSPEHGNWKLAIHRQTTGLYDAFSFDLNLAVVSGQTYTLDFYAQTVTDFEAGGGAVLIGISSSATSFGTQIFSGVPGNTAWTHFTQTLTAPIAGAYLTVESDPNGPPTWNHIDNFSLTPVPEPGTLVLLAIGFAGLTRRSHGKPPR